MAVNVDIVYKTVLLILNQQQRGYITPDEFNKVATQVQLTMFEAYAGDLNQQYRTPARDGLCKAMSVSKIHRPDGNVHPSVASHAASR